MAINLKITGSAEYGRYIKALIAGDPGAGKTLISSTFPSPIIASAEGGLMSLADRAVPFVEITASEQLNQLKNLFTQDIDVREKLLGVRAETLVIDTLDEVQKILIRERLESTRQDALKIADWGWLGDQMRLIVRTLRNVNAHVVFTCHLKRVENQETGAVTYEPAIQGGFGNELPGYVDLALVLKARPVSKVINKETKRVMSRYLQSFPDNSYTWLKDRSGKLPQLYEANLVDDFTRINSLIFGAAIAAEEASAQSSSKEVGAPPEATPAPTSDQLELSVTPAEPEATADAPVSFGTCTACGADIPTQDLVDLCALKRLPLLCQDDLKAKTAKK